MVDQQRRLRHIMLAILAGYLAIGAALLFWSGARAPVILARGDNPRQVEAALRIQRGQLLDVNGEVLAMTTIGADGRARRVYPFPEAGAAVGYYSFRHGTAGAEAALDPILRGDSDDEWAEFWRELLNRPQQGRDARLTLNLDWQQTAYDLMAGRQGALLLFSLPEPASGSSLAARALVSQPGFDPNQLNARFDELVADGRAPLLNRATQGQYQPGLVLQPFLLAAALEQGLIQWDDLVENADRPVEVNQTVLTCASQPPSPATWGDALRHACPYPLFELATLLGEGGVIEALADFGFSDAPSILIETSPPPEQMLDDLLLAAVGQDVLTVTPWQVGLAIGSLFNDGAAVHSQLVTAVQAEDGRWQSRLLPPAEEQIVRPATAQRVRQSLPRDAGRVEWAVRALSGPEGGFDSWYIGLAPATAPRYAVIVVLEGVNDVGPAQEIGRALLAHVLEG